MKIEGGGLLQGAEKKKKKTGCCGHLGTMTYPTRKTSNGGLTSRGKEAGTPYTPATYEKLHAS